MRFPFGTLPANLAAFCSALRRERLSSIGPRELMDAARALETADITNAREVRHVLRPILSKTFEEARAFDAAFDRFFLVGRPALPPAAVEGGGETHARTTDEPREPKTEVAGSPVAGSPAETVDTDIAAGNVAGGAVRGIADAAGDEAQARLRASYSPLGAEGEPVVLEPPSREWLEAAAVLVKRLRAGTSRRWRPAARGPRFDFRRTLRASLHTGGEAVLPKWRARPKRYPRLVMLIDGSRSMGTSSRPALQAAVALSAAAANTETFAFSTMLRRVTRDVRRAAAGEHRTIDLHLAWGGGTTIGTCLHEFLVHHGGRMLGPDTVVIIASDGLDVGVPDLLRDSMASLARRTLAILWINPLLATRGYEPTAAGMRLARPFVSALTIVNQAADLETFARTYSRRTPRR